MVINNVRVYGLDESVSASGYPMRTKIKVENEKEDYHRAEKLGNTPKGSGHDNFLNGIIVQFDLTFTVKAWTEAERYHFLEFVSSQSTMHCLSKFDLSEQYNKYVDPVIKDRMEVLKNIYLKTKDTEDYLRLLYSNPNGFKLTARMTTNYRQLKTIHSQRKTHKLPEWREFCKEIEDLPKFKKFCLGGK